MAGTAISRFVRETVAFFLLRENRDSPRVILRLSPNGTNVPGSLAKSSI